MADWDERLARWQADGLVDAATAARIREWEAAHGESPRARWPVAMLWALGGVLLGAGVLLFVAAHWEDIGPDVRFALVLAMVSGFHVGAAMAAPSYPVLATVLHGVGTAAVGAGIFLAGQIFNLQEHWPGGILLWAVAAAIAWAVLRDGVQAGVLGLLAPAWLVAEWLVVIDDRSSPRLWRPAGEGLWVLAATYAAAAPGGVRDGSRHALARIGSLALLPAGVAVVLLGTGDWGYGEYAIPGDLAFMLAWTVAFGAPLLLAVALRGTAAWPTAVAILWAVVVGGPWMRFLDGPRYLLSGLGAVGVVWWGLQEAHAARINVGVAGFAVTVLAFYFSSVMDKLDRSLSLIGLGVLFLGGGWALERMRRRLLAQVGARNG